MCSWPVCTLVAAMNSGARVGAQPLEIDEALDQVLERIDVERVEVVGRKIARPGRRTSLQPASLRSGSNENSRSDHRALQRAAGRRRGSPRARNRPAACAPRRAAARSPSASITALTAPAEVPEMPSIVEPPVLEQMVEHAPGEGAMRAAALQRQIDALSCRLSVAALARRRRGRASLTARSSRRRSNRPSR